MRTVYHSVSFVALLVICLMFAPARYFTGDHSIYPTQFANFPAPPSPKTDKPFPELLRDDPVAAVALSMSRYRASVEGYSCTFIKRERINGKLRDRETIQADFRESPFSVRLQWVEGMDRAFAMLYPVDNRADRLAVVPSNSALRKIVPFATRAIDHPDVRDAARSPVTEFGILSATNRVYVVWRLAAERGELRTKYEGTRPIEELGGRVCHVLHRNCVTPEEDGMTQVTLFFDTESLFQVGAILKKDEELIASYFYRDVVLNPKFQADHFTTQKLK
jgi:hypothetical protein